MVKANPFLSQIFYINKMDDLAKLRSCLEFFMKLNVRHDYIDCNVIILFFEYNTVIMC